MIHKLKKLLNNKDGIILAGVIAISFMFFSSIIWLVGALVVNKVFDAFYPIYLNLDSRALVTAQTAVNAYGVSIVITDVLLLVWWGLSASKVESQEQPMGMY